MVVAAFSSGYLVKSNFCIAENSLLRFSYAKESVIIDNLLTAIEIYENDTKSLGLAGIDVDYRLIVSDSLLSSLENRNIILPNVEHRELLALYDEVAITNLEGKGICVEAVRRFYRTPMANPIQTAE